MEINNDCIKELRKQLQNGKIQKGYKAILEYLLYLQSYLKKKYADYDFPGTLYHGYLDMSYFACIPATLKDQASSKLFVERPPHINSSSSASKGSLSEP